MSAPSGRVRETCKIEGPLGTFVVRKTVDGLSVELPPKAMELLGLRAEMKYTDAGRLALIYQDDRLLSALKG